MDEDEAGDEDGDEYDSDLGELDEERIISEFNVSINHAGYLFCFKSFPP